MAAWGGHGGFGGGFGGHGLGHHPPGQHGPSQVPGLPFSGIPSEMVPGVKKLVAREPEHPEPDVGFSHVNPETRPFTLKRFLRPHLWAIAIGVALVVVETLALQAGPLLTQRAIDHGVVPGEFGVVAAMAAVYLGAVLAHSVASALRVIWAGRLGQKLMYRLRVRVFSHVLRQSLDFFTEEKLGRVMTRMTSDIEALTELLQDGIITLAVQALTLAVVVGVLFAMDVELAAVVTFAVVPVMLVLSMWFRSSSERAYATVRNRIADVMADFSESLSGIRVATAHNRQWFNEARHRDIVGEHRSANERAARLAALYGPGSDMVGVLGQALIVLVGGWMVLRGELTLGQLTAFLLYLSAFFGPIQQLVHLYDTYQSGQAAVAKLRDLLATPPTVEERADAEELPPLRGEISLEHVTFGYEPGRPVLRDVTLTAAPGETVALVGATGGGKSTIAKLVTRFYDPQEGRVLVDGQDLRRVRMDSLRRQLGVVPQEPFLFGGTLRDNIAFARPEATDDDVHAACRAVGLDELVERLPDGLDTLVLERGSSLSSGERQLVALARAFLAAPRVLILDEATSSLDQRSEEVIEHALDNLLDGRTALVIAHRLSTAMRADRIAVVDDGRIAELGSHDELVARGGLYAGMFERWTTSGNAGARVSANGSPAGDRPGGSPRG